jgi:hypothetical protein
MYDPANDAYASPEDPTAYNIRPISPVHGLPIGIDPLTGLPWGVDPNVYNVDDAFAALQNELMYLPQDLYLAAAAFPTEY